MQIPTLGKRRKPMSSVTSLIEEYNNQTTFAYLGQCDSNINDVHADYDAHTDHSDHMSQG